MEGLAVVRASGLVGASHFAQVMWDLLKKMACKEPLFRRARTERNLTRGTSWQARQHCLWPTEGNLTGGTSWQARQHLLNSHPWWGHLLLGPSRGTSACER